MNSLGLRKKKNPLKTIYHKKPYTSFSQADSTVTTTTPTFEGSELPVSGSLTTTIKTAASTSSNDSKPQILSNIVINGSNTAALNPIVKKELQKVLASNLNKQNILKILPSQSSPQLLPPEEHSEQSGEPTTEEAKPIKEENTSDEEAKRVDDKNDSFVVTPDYIQQS